MTLVTYGDESDNQSRLPEHTHLHRHTDTTAR